MNGQWLKLHRKSIDSRVFSDPVMWHLWTWLLMEANWKLGYFQGYEVLPGSLATSYESISKIMKCSKSAAERRIKKLVEWGMISTKTGRHFTIISICNWKTYQNNDQQERDSSGILAGSQRDSSGILAGSQRDSSGILAGTIEERKEEKEREEGKDTREKPERFLSESSKTDQPKTSPEIISAAQQYCFLSTKKNKFGYPAESEEQIAPVFAELVRLGIPIAFLLDHIHDRNRNRNQAIWEFEKAVQTAWKQSQQPEKPVPKFDWEEMKARFEASAKERRKKEQEALNERMRRGVHTN